MKFTLDYSIWRCGMSGNPNMLGKGSTKMRNPEGFECCLGQFSKQANPEITDEMLLNKYTPGGIPVLIPELNEEVAQKYHVTDLAGYAMTINDDETTTPDEKIAALKELFAKHGHEIKVINHPKKLKNEIYTGLRNLAVRFGWKK